MVVRLAPMEAVVVMVPAEEVEAGVVMALGLMQL